MHPHGAAQRPAAAVLLGLVAVLAALAVAPSAAAQAPDTPYQAHLAFGDVPTTAASEPADRWNLAQSLLAHHATGAETTVRFSLPGGFAHVAASCTCGTVQASATDTQVTVVVPAAAETGEHRVTSVARGPAGQAVALTLAPPAGAVAEEQSAVVFAPSGHGVRSGATLREETLLGRQASVARGSDQPLATWFAAAPGAAVEPGPTPEPEAEGFDWIAAGVGVFAGIVIWGILVQLGYVQKRGRKQVAAVAAHVEAAKAEPKEVLEGRKRALMAALKEVELARQANEIDVPTYDALKADFKKQAVTVMRALEENDAPR